MRTIMVHSYKGGTGKSLVSVNLAQQLHLQGLSVLVIEMDYGGAELSLDREIGKKQINSGGHAYLLDYFVNGDSEQLHNYINHDENGFDIIFSQPVLDLHSYLLENGISLLDLDNWYLQQTRLLSEGLNNLDYDWVIIDTSPGIHRIAVNAVYLVDDIILTARANDASIQSTYELLDEFYNGSILNSITRDKRMYLIINQQPDQNLVDDHQIELQMENYMTKFQVLDFPKFQLEQLFVFKFDVPTLITSMIGSLLIPSQFQFSKDISRLVTSIMN